MQRTSPVRKRKSAGCRRLRPTGCRSSSAPTGIHWTALRVSAPLSLGRSAQSGRSLLIKKPPGPPAGTSPPARCMAPAGPVVNRATQGDDGIGNGSSMTEETVREALRTTERVAPPPTVKLWLMSVSGSPLSRSTVT